MRLETALNAPLAAMIHAERRVNLGSPSGFAYGVSPETHPLTGSPLVRIPLFEGGVETLTSRHVPPSMVARVQSLLGTAIPLHPDVVRRERNAAWVETLRQVGTIAAVPTASGRTLFVQENEDTGIFLKLHYDAVLGRFNRSIMRRHTEAAFDVGEIMHGALVAGGDLAFLDEPISRVLTGRGLEQGVSALFRDLTPVPPRSEERLFLPLFALFSPDHEAPRDPVLLTQLFDGGAMLVERLLSPIIKGFLKLALDYGVIPEANAQNFLVALRSDGSVSRVIIRDLQGFFRDRRFLSAAALTAMRTNRKMLDDSTNEGAQRAKKQRSYLFDFKLGTYVLDPLIDKLGGDGIALKAMLRQLVLESFRRRAIDPSEYFPSNGAWYAQTDTVFDQGGEFFVQRAEPTYR